MRGYKIFSSNWTYYNSSWTVGETIECPGTKWGFHFCPRALDCLRYNALDESQRYVEVEAGDVDTQGFRCTTNHLKIVRELSLKEFAALCTGTLTTYQNGVKVRESNFLRGERHGVCTFWYKNGMKRFEFNYVGGEQHGESTEWRPDGSKQYDWIYERGVIQNRTSWSKSGQKEYDLCGN